MEKGAKRVILESACKIVENEGFEKLTVRNIIEATGKNLNAINYYYGSKEKLELEIIKCFFDNIYGEFFNFDKENCSMEEFLNIYCTMMIKNRKLFKKIFSCLISEKREVADEISKYVREKIGEAVKKISDRRIETLEEKIEYFQEMSAVIYPVLILESVENMFGFNIEDEELRKKYIKILLNKKGE